jgi:xanthine dehydrogenase accessory factor
MQEVAEDILAWHEAGTPAVFARVLSMEGFSTWAGDELVALNQAGEQRGDLLGRYGAEQLASAGSGLLAGTPALGRLAIEVHGKRVAEAGLSCGGQVELLLQPSATVPGDLWTAIARRAPVALVTAIDGPDAGPLGAVVHPGGRWSGAVGAAPGARPPEEALAAAGDLLPAGSTARHVLEHPLGTFLVEAWVPDPRLVLIGGGDLAAAIAAQAALLGWESRASEDVEAFPALFDWGGASTALVVLSHNPHLDTPALIEGLGRDIAYVGAMGSRRTQSGRVERLEAQGVTEDAMGRIHRPIGLDCHLRRDPGGA